MADSSLISIGKLSNLTGLHISLLRRLADAKVIPSVQLPSGHRRFDPQAVSLALSKSRHPRSLPRSASEKFQLKSVNWTKTLALQGLQEDLVWKELSQNLDLRKRTPAEEILQHAFTEMLNNAIDHSGGDFVKIQVQASAESLAFEITDNGVGAFAKLRDGLGLDSELESIAELSKGKRTTDPKRHTGEGIFFSSKAVDYFRISANGESWLNDNLQRDWAVQASPLTQGTQVYSQISRSSTRSLQKVFSEFTEDFEFVRTKPVVKLFETGLNFVSRSEAKRLVRGLEKFKEITLDFQKVESVGQGFVDEIFRVWKSDHPLQEITPVNMNESVNFMVQRGLARATELGQNH